MATFPKRFPRYLAFASEDTPLRISRIPLAHLRAACAQRGLMEGDRVRRIGAFTDHIVLRGPNGARILLESRLAAAVEIEPAALARL